MRRFFQLTVLLTACIGWMACGNDLVQEYNTLGKVYTLTVDAQRGGQCAATRGLTDDLQAVWSAGDEVTLLKNNNLIGTMTPKPTGTKSTQLSTTLTGTVELGDPLTLVLPRSERSYIGQKGTIADIASKYDYATADVIVRYVNGTSASTTNAVFENQQAIVKFSLTDGSNPLAVSSLTISADGLKQNATSTGDITITPDSPTSELYAALSGVNGIVKLSATAGDATYSYASSAAKTFKNGSYYPITVKMKREADPMLAEPLTFEAKENNIQITFTNNASGKVQFSRNGAEWIDISSGESKNITIEYAGEKIFFRGDNTSYFPGNDASKIECDRPCYIYGNIMSLISSNGFELLTALPEGENTFRGLFENCTNLTNHSEKDLLLPAIELQANCYQSMFAGCTGLTRAPLLSAPTLRAYCYQSMFAGCSNLSYIKCLATNIQATECTDNWVEDVKSTGTFVKAASMENWQTGKSGIPSGWSVQ